jgi:hypothetical protein
VRIEQITFTLLKRNHVVLADENAYPLGIDLALAPQAHHTRDHETVLVVRLDFRPLGHVDDVLEDQPMHPQDLADSPQDVRVAQAANVHPVFRIVLEQRAKLAGIGELTFFKSHRRVPECLDGWARCGAASSMTSVPG